LTLGGEGMVLVTEDGQISRIPTMAREVFDVSGAGDTVTAGGGPALAAGAAVREGALLANYAAGIEVAKAGVATVSPPEVLAVHEAEYDQLGRLRRGGLLCTRNAEVGTRNGRAELLAYVPRSEFRVILPPAGPSLSG